MRALTIVLCLLATPALTDVAGVASVINATHGDNGAACSPSGQMVRQSLDSGTPDVRSHLNPKPVHPRA